MRQYLSALLLGVVCLALVVGVVVFGAVTLEYAAPVYALAILAALLWAGRLLLDQTATWPPSRLQIPVAVFFLYALWRYWASPIEYDSRLELIQLGLYCFFFFLVSTNPARARDRTILLLALTCLAFLESLYGGWQFITHAETCLNLRRPESYFHRASGTFICPNHLAGFAEIVLAMLLARIAILRPPKASIQRIALKKIIWSYAALVILVGVALTLSRASWISVCAGFLIFLLLKGWETKTIWPRILVSAAGLIIILILASQIGPVRNYIRVSLSHQETASTLAGDANLGTRISMWRGTLDLIAHHPLFGTGPGTWQWFHQVYRDPDMQMHPLYAHNDYLNFAADYGLVGLLLLLAMVVIFFRQTYRSLSPEVPSEQRAFAMGAIVAVFILLVHSLFDFNLHIPSNALLLIALAGFAVGLEDRRMERRRLGMKLWLRATLALILIAGATAFSWFGSRMFLAHQHISRGTEAKNTVDLKTAVYHFQEAIKLDPKNPTPYARLGDIYSTYAGLPQRPGQQNERAAMLNYAIEVYTKSVELNRYQSDVVVRLATAYDKNGDIESAVRAFQEALAVDPNNASIYFHLGSFYLRLGESQKARAAFQKSRELNFWSNPGAWLQLEQIKPQP